MRRETHLSLWLLGPASLALVLGVLYALDIPADRTRFLVSNALFVFLSAAATAGCVLASRSPGISGQPWRWFAAGCCAWCLGAITWAIHGLSSDRLAPYSSLTDIGFLTLYPCFFVGLLVIVRSGTGGRPSREIVLDTLLVALVVGVALVELILLPVRSGLHADPLALTASAVWQMGTFGIAFMTVICLAWRSNTIGRGPLILLLLGIVSFSAGNIAYARTAFTDSYYNGHPLDLTWQFGLLCIGAAAIQTVRQRVMELPEIAPTHKRARIYWRGMATVICGVALTVVAVISATRDSADSELAVIAGVVGIALSFRLGYAAVQGDRLGRRTRERDRLAAVVSASTAIAGSMPTEELLEQLVETAAHAVGRSRAELYVYARTGDRVESVAFYGFAPAEREVVKKLGDYDIGVFPAELRAIATKAPTIERIEEPGLAPEIAERLRCMGKEQTLVTPLLAHGEVVGLFATWSPYDTRPFESGDVDAASIISKQAGLAIYNARLLADARRQAEEQATLLRVSQASVSSTDTREVLRNIAKASLGIAGAESCGVDLWLPELGLIEVVSEETIDDWPGTCEPGRRFSLNDRPAMRRVFEEQAPLVLSAGDPNLASDIHDWFFTEDTRSVLMFPLMIGQECLGALNMYSRKLNAFSTTDLRIAREIADKAALGVRSARLFASTRRFAEEQAALLKVSQAVVSGQELRETLQVVAQATVGVAGAEGCEIELYDAASDVLEYVAHCFVDDWDPGSFAGVVERYPASEWPASLLALSRRSPVTFTIRDEAFDPEERRRFANDGISSVLIVPLVIGDHAFGLLSLYSREPEKFEAETERFALDLAAQAALAIDRDRMNAALQQRADTDGLTGALNHRAILESLDRSIARARRRAGPLSILLVDIDNFKLFNDTHGHLVGDQVLRSTTEILWRCIRESDQVGRYGGDEFLVVLEGAGSREAELVAARLLRDTGTTSITVGDLNLPLKLSVGIAVFPGHADTRQDLIAFADGGLYAAKEAGGGIARVTGRDADNREPSTFGTLMGLVRAVDRKDRYTKLHSDLVTEVAVRFGQDLGLDPEQLEALAIAGQLHDVGKIAVPDSILRKPGRLTPGESDILRQHVVFSELMVKGVPHLASVSAAIANHHERWDGCGYPHGLQGVEIPLLGRIMALADAWSAMVHDRPYRKRLDHEGAVAQIKNGAGQQFDPTLVERFAGVVDRMESERKSQLRDDVATELDELGATG